MAYVTTTQLSARLGSTLYARLTDRVSGVTADAAVAQQIIDEAEAEVNAYLVRRYATPIDLSARPELGDMLEARVLDVAEYVAWKSSPFVSDVPERIRLMYAETLRWLEAVASGRMLLPASANPATGRLSDAAPLYSARPPLFTREELDGL